MPIAVKTFFASVTAAGLRAAWMPIDTVKTTLQVEGKDGFHILKQRVRHNGPSRLYYGAMGAMVSKWAAHFPFFSVYNYLQTLTPVPEGLRAKLIRNGCIGFAASVVSDSCANTFRVLKTYRQTHAEKISYLDAAKMVTKQDGGAKGLLSRGLFTRILSNGLQGIVFLVLWTVIDEKFFGGHSMRLKIESQNNQVQKHERHQPRSF